MELSSPVVSSQAGLGEELVAVAWDRALAVVLGPWLGCWQPLCGCGDWGEAGCSSSLLGADLLFTLR